jgi:tyrosinase
MPQRAVQTTYTNSVGQEQTSSTPLTPFYDANGKFWTSDGVRDIQTFGYAYPETIGKSRQRVTAAINRLYSSTSRNQGLARRRMVVSGATLYPTNTYREWIVNVVVKKHALGVPFFIHVFLGDFNPKPSSWYILLLD